ncbi:MAG: hypothetical protein WB791_01900 [Waddliaceae bacterium]
MALQEKVKPIRSFSRLNSHTQRATEEVLAQLNRKVEDKTFSLPIIAAIISEADSQLFNQYKIFMLVDQVLKLEEKKSGKKKSRNQLKVVKQLLKKSSKIQVMVNPPKVVGIQHFIENMVAEAEEATRRKEYLSLAMKQKAIHFRNCVRHLQEIPSDQETMQHTKALEVLQEFFATSIEFIHIFLQEKINTLLVQS